MGQKEEERCGIAVSLEGMPDVAERGTPEKRLNKWKPLKRHDWQSYLHLNHKHSSVF